MIALKKLEKPEVLKTHAKDWTNQYIEYLNKNIKIPANLKGKYRDKKIKATIMLETNGKCAYCESKVEHISFGDVEHILPKKHRPDLIFEWENLTLSCEQCNRTRKKDYYNPNDPLINPYTDEPEELLIAHGPIISGLPGNRKGQLTVELLELNRVQLFERRYEKIQHVLPLINRWANEPNTAFKEVLFNQILQEIENSREYSFVLKSVWLNTLEAVENNKVKKA